MELRKAPTQLAIGQRPQLCPTDRAWPQTEQLSDSPSRYRVVAGDHPDIDASRQRRSYGPFGLGSQRVDNPSHPDEGEVACQRHGIVAHDLSLIALDEPRCECQHPQTTFTHPFIRCLNAGAPRRWGPVSRSTGRPHASSAPTRRRAHPSPARSCARRHRPGRGGTWP